MLQEPVPASLSLSYPVSPYRHRLENIEARKAEGSIRLDVGQWPWKLDLPPPNSWGACGFCSQWKLVRAASGSLMCRTPGTPTSSASLVFFQVLKWVESAIQASKVHLLSADHEEEGEHTWRIPFDPSLKEVTISLSGPGPEIEVRDPLGMCFRVNLLFRPKTDWKARVRQKGLGRRRLRDESVNKMSASQTWEPESECPAPM